MNQTLTAFFSHAQTSHGVTVRVAVTFLPEQSEPDRARWFWAYHIRIENGRSAPVQLLTRNWTISDGRGALHHVEGEGVVGEQPVIQPGGAYDYVSGCPLNTPTGWMTGSYRMLDSDGGTLEIAIPQFNLLAPAVSD